MAESPDVSFHDTPNLVTVHGDVLARAYGLWDRHVALREGYYEVLVDDLNDLSMTARRKLARAELGEDE